MDDKILIRELSLKNLLSFGGQGQTLRLQPLNVLIGPNGSGKSNLIEAISILQAAPRDLAAPIREGGGVSEWLWKGDSHSPAAELNTEVLYPAGHGPLRYKLCFGMSGQRMELIDEAVENVFRQSDSDDVYFYYRFQRGHPVLNIRKIGIDLGKTGPYYERRLQREDLQPNQSVLSQRKDPEQYPEITYLGNVFSKIKIYREWDFGRYTKPRMPQKADLPEDFLEENAGNLGLVLNDLEHRAGLKQQLLEKLRQFYGEVADITTRIQGGTVQVFLHEEGINLPIPATRLSDGTLRYLSLLSILIHPTPPPLICIEEPELGLHPDILPTIAQMLIEASKRTQLVVTTHSDILVSALQEVSESIIVCGRTKHGTVMQRLDNEKLADWLEKYPLGELWRMGELGGTRW